jgi:ribosome modulation factor
MDIEMDEQAWLRGFDDGEQGKPLNECPYQIGSDGSSSWISGYIEGKAARDGYTVIRPARGGIETPRRGETCEKLHLLPPCKGQIS